MLRPRGTILALLLGVIAWIGGCRRKVAPHAHHAGQEQSQQTHMAPPLDVEILDVRDVTGARRSGPFFRGESLTILLRVSGLAPHGPRTQLRASLQLSGPKGRLLWSREEHLSLASRTRGRRLTARLKLSFRLSPAEPTGPHELSIRIQDPGSGRQGLDVLRFQVAGRALISSRTFRVHRIWTPSGRDLRPAGLLPVSAWLSGFRLVDEHPRAAPGRPRWRVRLSVAARYHDTSGHLVREAKALAADDLLPFQPAELPVSAELALPERPGTYRLELIFRDDLSGRTVRATQDLNLPPAGLGIYGLRLVGPSGTVEPAYRRFEPVIAKFWVWAPKPVSVVGDVALQGPDGGLYHRQRKAFRLDRQHLAKAPVALSIPFRVPEFAPVGRYRFHVRVRAGGETATRWQTFQVSGRPIPVLAGLQITRLRLGRGSGPLLVLGGGQDLPFEIVVGGMRVEQSPPAAHRVSLQVDFLLRDLDGRLVQEDAHVLDFDRTLPFLPRRLLLRGTWRVPEGNYGLMLLQVRVLDLLSRRTALSQRKVYLRER